MSGLRFDLKHLDKGLDWHRMMTQYALRQAGSMEAKRLAIHAKSHKPWQTHSGRAVGSIHGWADFGGDQLKITISGGVNYMVYLEFAMKKRWAILWPTIEKKGQSAVENIARFMKVAMK